MIILPDKSVEILQIGSISSSKESFVKTSKTFLQKLLRQEADRFGIQRVLWKMMNCLVEHLQKIYVK